MDYLNNSDIRCGLIHSIKLSYNYVIGLYCDNNDYCEIEWKNEELQNAFMKELNNIMIYVIENSFLNNLENNKSLYDEISTLINKYEEHNLLIIKTN